MRICRAPECPNPAISQRTVCTKHKHRLRKSKTFDIPERVKKCEKLPSDFVKDCKVHGLLKFDQVNIQYSKYKEKRYKWYQCKECVSLKRQRLYWENPEKYNKQSMDTRERRLTKAKKKNREYHITCYMPLDKFEEMIKDQNNRCKICNKEETALYKTGQVKRLSIDHNHKTGKARALLCGKCNTALGLFMESPEILESAIKYLRSFSSLPSSLEDSRVYEDQPE